MTIGRGSHALRTTLRSAWRGGGIRGAGRCAIRAGCHGELADRGRFSVRAAWDRARVMQDLEPQDAFREDVVRSVRTWRERIADRARGWVTRWLVGVALTSAAGVVLAVVSLPLIAAVFCAVATAASLCTAVWARRLLYRERAARRWSWVAGKRAQQDVLTREQTVDTAVLVIVGEPEDRALAVGTRAAELRQAVSYVRGRLAEAHASSRPQPASAKHRRPTAPKKPDLAPVRRRRERRAAEIKALEAEIQQLANPDDAAAAMAAEEARTHARSVRQSAMDADQAARERARRGQTATARTEGTPIEIAFKADGSRDVRRGARRVSPEEIAQGAARRAAGEEKGSATA